MSEFLGPIHNWLFNKIKLIEERERVVSAKLAALYGDKASALREQLETQYGSFFDDTSLELIAGDTPIQNFLAEAIKKVETREAAFLASIIKAHGKEAEEAALSASYEHGNKQGLAAVEEYQGKDKTPEEVYKIFKNYYLDGMPSDHVVEIEHNAEQSFIERHSECLHSAYWEEAGADNKFMCKYLARWKDGFIGAFKGLRHSLNKTIVNGDDMCEDVFEKKE